MAPSGVVVECWPPVMPKLRLFITTTVIPTLRRAALSRWAPPIPVPPSPITTITSSDGSASLIPLGVGDAPPVQPVEGAGGEILVRQARAADVADDDDLLRVPAQPYQRHVEPIEHRSVAAARTERVGLVVTERLERRDRSDRRHPIASATCSTPMSSPSTRFTPITARPPETRSISRRYWPRLSSGTTTRSTPSIAAPMAASGTGHRLWMARCETAWPAARACATATRAAPVVTP